MMLVQPDEAWKPIKDPIYNTVDHRSPDLLVLCLKQLDVEHVRRYQAQHPPGGSLRTFCNIYLWDATTVLCQQDQIPHWVDMVSTASFQDEHTVRQELSALGCIEWTRQHGAEHGWTQASAEQARAAAHLGQPAYVLWANPTKYLSSHVAMLLPSPDPGPQLIAQSGAECLWAQPLARGFGAAAPLEYWTHP
jgi:hypothetical protein